MLPSSVRAGLANALKVDGLNGVKIYEVVPEVLVAPCAYIGQLSIDFDTANARGLDTADVDVVLIVSRTVEKSAQDKLDTWLAGTGTTSIKAILEADRTLGGAVSSLRVLSATPGEFENAGINYLAYRYRLKVYG